MMICKEANVCSLNKYLMFRVFTWYNSPKYHCSNCRHLYKMEGSSNFVFKINKLRTVLAERRVQLDLSIPNLYVEGSYKCDRMSYGDYDSKASGYFRLGTHGIIGIILK